MDPRHSLPPRRRGRGWVLLFLSPTEAKNSLMHQGHNLLKERTIVVTRPAHQAQALYKQITAWGGRCLVFPSLIITPLVDLPQLNPIFHAAPPIDKFIFTSANAVTAVMPYWPAQKPWSVFAIGPGTAQALAASSITAQLPKDGEYSSEGLLRLPALQSVSQQKIVIFSGLGGKDLLEKMLTAKGAHVQKIAVYQRVRPSTINTLDWQQGIDFLISTSCESLESLCAMINPADQSILKHTQLVVISEKMRNLAIRLGFTKLPLVAKNASDAEILQVLATAVGTGL
jgi:uroporphyrinogen-III synthase